MFLRRNRKIINGEEYEYWTLVESVRTLKGPRQRIVATVGKEVGLDKEERVGWEEIQAALQGREETAADLFKKKEQIKTPEWAEIKVRDIQIERLRSFGDVYLGLTLWKKLKLDEIFSKIQNKGKEDTDWNQVFCLLVLARFCYPSSELEIAESWYEKTALDDLLGIPAIKTNEDRLYRALDKLLPHKDEISKHLQDRYRDLFGTDFEFLIYDVTSIYFEGECNKNTRAKRGYSRDHRSDCLQVCIGLVVTIEGLPVGYEVFDGNRADVTTLFDMIELMEKKYGKANRVWVFDRGIVSEENLEELRKRKANYIVGTSKSLINKMGYELAEKDWHEVENGVEVKFINSPDGVCEKFILCRSKGRIAKERAIFELQKNRLEEKLKNIQTSIQKGKLKNPSSAERRIGRWLGRFTQVERLFDVKLIYDEQNQLKDLQIAVRKDNVDWEESIQGNYILRTNWDEKDPCRIWKQYMQLTQAENAFRISKDHLGIRPVYHQKTNRVEAHIFVCFLALSLWKTLEGWMSSKGLGNSPNKLLQEFKTIHSMDVLLPVKDKSILRLRIVNCPDRHVKILLHHLELKIPNKPKFIQNVVENLPLKDT